MSFNNRNTGLIRANIGYGKNVGREHFLTETGYF